jgi:hypothetical protein
MRSLRSPAADGTQQRLLLVADRWRQRAGYRMSAAASRCLPIRSAGPSPGYTFPFWRTGPLGDRAEPVLQALQAASPNRFRGIRHTVTWDRHPEIENREREGVLASADYRAGAQVLARMGLVQRG